MQDYAGLPPLPDLAGLRNDAIKLDQDPTEVAPSLPIALVIDHSIMANFGGARKRNEAVKFEQNTERFRLLKWAQAAFENVQIIPSGKGILHQINLEHLSTGVTVETREDQRWLVPDSLFGTDSHPTMVGSISVLGRGVGGIEATSCLLGDGVSLQWPKVLGVRLIGKRAAHLQAADIALHLTKTLREHGVVEYFVEFTGTRLVQLSVSDRATLANMAPEYGATVAFFPTDAKTLDHFALVGRDQHHIDRIEAYAHAQGLWHGPDTIEPTFETVIQVDLSEIGTTFASPTRLEQALKPAQTSALFATSVAETTPASPLQDGDIVLAVITSCTNTAHPTAMITAGLVARKAVSLGLKVSPNIKTTFAPGSQVIRHYLNAAGLLKGFGIAGFGCMICVGNSGPLGSGILAEIEAGGRDVCSVLSGTRNFEGRIHKAIKSSFLMSPPHVIVAALAGHLRLDVERDVLAQTTNGVDIHLSDLWTSDAEVREIAHPYIQANDYKETCATIDQGRDVWLALNAPAGATFEWEPDSHYIRRPLAKPKQPNRGSIEDARALLYLGHNVTTDHISPVGAIDPESPAGRYLLACDVPIEAFNTYGARRGNHNVMLRGTFANPRFANRFIQNRTGGWTFGPDGQTITTVQSVAMAFAKPNIPTIICAGHAYGSGSTRDCAAKGTAGLGVQAVIARSFERIHRTNLILCGVLPLTLPEGFDWDTFGLHPTDQISLVPNTQLTPDGHVTVIVKRANGSNDCVTTHCAIRKHQELFQYCAGGVLAQRRNQIKTSCSTQQATSKIL